MGLLSVYVNSRYLLIMYLASKSKATPCLLYTKKMHIISINSRLWNGATPWAFLV
jgi:hypothetical protein